MPAKPMLDELELEQVQKIEAEENEVVSQHRIPALEGDFLQDLGRRAVRITLNGVLTGAEAANGLKQLREKFQKAAPVPFVADIATATTVDQVLVEEMNIRELAGKPERFEYALAIREFIAPPQPEQQQPPPQPLPKPHPVDTATLIVEVIVDGQPNFDFSTVTVTVDGTEATSAPAGGAQAASAHLSRTLTNRQDNVWTEDDMPPGQYTVQAVVTAPQAMTGSASAQLQAGQTTHAIIHLTPGAVIAKAFIVHFWFDKAFVEPCLAEVLAHVADYAQSHPDEKLIILGHTDLVGSADYNQSLSERRGRSVFAYLTFGRDPDNALAEWENLRQPALGALPTIKDTWGTREYQYMLQDLDYYQGNIDGLYGPATAAGLRAFQQDHSLPVTGAIDDATWKALIQAYMAQHSLTIPESQFFGNCSGEILKWLGAGEQDPVRNTQDAWRPNRRTELLFVNATTISCPVPKPVTFNQPTPGFVDNDWCLGPDDGPNRDCFVARDPEQQQPGQFLVQPAEPGTVIVSGSIKNEDSSPAANTKYVLLAPDGEYMDGERPAGEQRGRPIPGITGQDGSFSYPDKPKGIGIYILEVQGPFVARLAEDPPDSGKGNTICKRLDGTSPFNVVISPADTDPTRKLRATIFDHFGQPRKQTAVQVVFSDGTQASTTTNDEGKFVVEMQNPQDIAKIRYQIADDDPDDVMNFVDFFVDVQGVDRDEGVRRRLHNLGYRPEDDLTTAIVSFQAAQGLDTTGEADDATHTKLTAVHDGSDPPVPEFAFSQQPLSTDQLNDAGPPLQGED